VWVDSYVPRVATCAPMPHVDVSRALYEGARSKPREPSQGANVLPGGY